ncbi:MAG: alanine--tRNA ligase, partial [Proteobacteria bacterium]|nr:alanine--tRNA ligase [Pseudomonadota bacterium]
MSGHEIRQKFLDYFAEQGHRPVKSSPLLLPKDPTLLFANAGMNQFKDVFLGNEKRDYSRATTSQKCVRAGGKHNDLDEVGRTARHHTFFEMLGNFSFGDYFKREAIAYAWDLIVHHYGLSVDRLWFTIYKDDDEAGELWKAVGAPADRILKFGEKENFWEMGETGPCGPCSEIHYFMGDDMSQNTPDKVNGTGDDNIEIWNLVFMQYYRDETGALTPLPKPSVDTGMGLERISTIMQGKRTNYETDLIRPIIDRISELSRKPYVSVEAGGVPTDEDSENAFSMRVIADHARATAFCITDGIFPGNDGRAYVLRKIMRRALWHGHRLGLPSPFFHQITDFVVDLMAGPYPELVAARDIIRQVVTTEDRLFASTLASGIKRLEDIIRKTESTAISGADAFTLYDTYGLREDLITYIAEQSGYTVDWAAFQTELESQRQRARESWKGAAAKKTREVYTQLSEQLSTFTGYHETTTGGSRIRAIIVGEARVGEIGEGQEAELVLDRTPFYAESGGQVGDTGFLESDDARFRVNDTQAPLHGVIIHRGVLEYGRLAEGALVTGHVDDARRDRVRANHTGTHLLHAALQQVLGPHVKQAGSLVAPERLRFDFTHYAALTSDQVTEIERLVNVEILRNLSVSTDLMELEQAVESGAMALFGEKYADRVRVVSVPGFSRELCGGTHVRATGDIGLLKIVSDASVAAGVRRVEALTGVGAFNRYQALESQVGHLAQRLNTTPDALGDQIDRLSAQLKAAQRELDSLKMKMASQAAGGAVEQARDLGGVRVLAQQVENLDGGGLRNLADELLGKLKSGVVVLGQADGGKATLLVKVSDDVKGRVPAGDLLKVLAEKVGGKGGGRPDMAQGGGPDV